MAGQMSAEEENTWKKWTGKMEELCEATKKGTVPTILFMGNTGHGKSSIINKIKSPYETKVAHVTDDQEGTTKIPEFYKCLLPDGTEYIAVDCTGVGDLDIKESWTIEFVQSVFASEGEAGLANGLFVVTKIGENPSMQGKLMGAVCKKCIDGGFANVAHVHTFADDFTPENVNRFVAKSQFARLYGSPPGHQLTTGKDDGQDVFHPIIEKMTMTKIQWKMASPEELAEIVADASGFTADRERVEEKTKEIVELREQLAKAKKKKSLLERVAGGIVGYATGGLPGAVKGAL